MTQLCMSGLAIASLLLSTALSPAAQVFREAFNADPATRGWQIHGDASLFGWNPSDGNLAVTWDSSRTNSFFQHPLGTVLSRQDDFNLAFDLRLFDLAIGTTPGKEFTFQLAVGLILGREARQAGFLRGTGTDSPNLVEFDYFPDSGFGATVSPTVISSNGVFATSFNSPLTLSPQDAFHVAMRYAASNQTLVTTMTRNGEPFGPVENLVLTNETFTDFRVDHFAVISYSDFGQDPDWDGSLLAHGVVDNIEWEVPEPPISAVRGSIRDGHWALECTGRPAWLYTLEATRDFSEWVPVSSADPDSEGVVRATDPGALGAHSFYRIRAERP